jgi:two-component system nitrogen regulation response regulator GlnG
MIGRCAAMVDVYRRIARIAPTTLTVLIEGETGTGKELVARGIHALSTRNSGPFIAVNSAGVPREIMESEFFGSERGAFTDAVTREGVFERASGGTVFLDEIGDLSASAQAVLLRVLDQKVVSRLGGRREIAVNVRVIAATNADLLTAVRDGRFREDLYYRLAQSSVRLPPLRSRGDDLQMLAEAFLNRLCRTVHGMTRRLSANAWSTLRGHSWPGNVRELENVLTQACTLARGDIVHAEDVAAVMAREGAGARVAIPPRRDGVTLTDALREIVETAERQWIIEALGKAGTRKDAARELGIDVRTLYHKMMAYRIVSPDTQC